MANLDDRVEMNRIAQGLPTTSAKIRALNAAGYRRADIARHLGKRYQHVRNVLEQEAKKAPPAGPLENGAATAPQITMKMGPEGRVVIPAEYRRALDLGDGDEVILSLEGDSLRLVSRDGAIKRVQAELARLVPVSVSLVDELFAERGREASREDRDG